MTVLFLAFVSAMFFTGVAIGARQALAAQTLTARIGADTRDAMVFGEADLALDFEAEEWRV